MKYWRILAAVAAEPWAIEPAKLRAILEFLQMQAAGVKFSGEEIEARISRQQEREVAQRQGAVAVIPVFGTIANRMNMMADISGGMTCDGFARAFQAAQRADDVKAIVIDCNSPGGTVYGVDETSDMVFGARGGKPIIAHVNALAASAAYWLVSAADEVVMTRTAEVGSIGVFTVHEEISKMLEAMGVVETLIKAGETKAENLPFFPLSEEAKGRIQARVDDYYAMMTKTIARNRGVTPAAVRDGFGKGGMVGAKQAVAEGMVDGIATLDETLQRFGASLYGAAPAPAPAPGGRAFASAREKRAIELT